MFGSMLKKLFIFSVCLSSSLFAQLTPTLRQSTQYSVRELEEWLKTQSRPNYVLPAKYSIAGQVTASWKNVYEKLGSQSQVGTDASKPSNQYSINSEILFNYFKGRTFGNARLNFRNTAGTFGGSANSISLSRAFIGYHILTYGPHTLDLNVGRRNLRKIYNSQIMFKSQADGITGFAYYMWKNIVEYQATMGLYTSNPASFWVVRGRLFNIANMGFYFDYDYIFWGKNKRSSSFFDLETKYGVSQFLIGWERIPAWLGSNLQFFVALLYNNRAQPNVLSLNKRQNLAGYVGGQFGTVKNKGDFSIQGQLQFCQLQAVPEWDMAGIGRGNTAKGDFFKASDVGLANGNTNFKGWEVKLNYALTKQITVSAELQRSLSLNKDIGQPANYTTFSLTSSYSF